MRECLVKTMALLLGVGPLGCGDARPSRAGAAPDGNELTGDAGAATGPAPEGGGGGAPGEDSGELSCASLVSFPDPALDAVLRSALGLSSSQSFSRDHLLSVTELEHVAGEDSDPVRSLDGVGCLSNLRSLSLVGRIRASGERDGVMDASPLRRLDQLRSLTIDNASFDLTPLGDLVLLRELRLDHAAPGSGATPADLDAIAPLVNLTLLDVSHGCIQDISAVAGMAALETIDLSHNCVEDLGPLDGLVTLRQVDVSENQYDCVRVADTLELLQSYGTAVIDDCS